MLSTAILATWMLTALDPAALAGQQGGKPQALWTASTELVVLPVTVTDRDGRFVSQLTPDSFTLYDNGRRQDIRFFTEKDTPVSVALVVDDSGSMRGKLGEVIAASLAFARWSNPDDELFVIEFNDRVRDALGGRRLTAADQPELESALRTLVPVGQTALYDALVDGLEHLEAGMHARKVLVLISDGGDNASDASLEQVLARARRSNVTIYTIGLFAAGASDADPGVLKKLARATGGARFLPRAPGPLLQACGRIAREIRSGYTLGYLPPERDRRYHEVRVKIEGAAGRGLKIRTRPGYFAAGDSAP